MEVRKSPQQRGLCVSTVCVCLSNGGTNVCRYETEPTQTETWIGRKRSEGGGQTRAAPATLPRKFRSKCLSLTNETVGNSWTGGRAVHRYSLFLFPSPTRSGFLRALLPQAALLRSRHSPKFTRTPASARGRPSLLARSRHSGFFHRLPPTEHRQDGRRPIFHFSADLRRTPLMPDVHHSASNSPRWIGGRPLSEMCPFCNVGEKRDGSLATRFHCSRRNYFDTFCALCLRLKC